MEAIVSDTTALIVLAKRQRLDLLGYCFDQVLLPEAVYREWLVGDTTVERTVQDLGFLRVVAVDETGFLKELQGLLDPGEAEALALARERGLTLLVDERKGRSIARMMGIPILGLVGVLLLAVEREVLTPEAAMEILVKAKGDGFRLSNRLYAAFVGHLGLM